MIFNLTSRAAILAWAWCNLANSIESSQLDDAVLVVSVLAAPGDRSVTNSEIFAEALKTNPQGGGVTL